MNKDCNYINTFNGTSAAVPMVSGALALILQANPNLSRRDIKYILAKTAYKIDPQSISNGRFPLDHPPLSTKVLSNDYDPGWITNAAGFHFNNHYGFGLIDVDKAIRRAEKVKELNLDQDFLGPLVESQPHFSKTILEKARGDIPEDMHKYQRFWSKANLEKSIPDRSLQGVTDTIHIEEDDNLIVEGVQIVVQAIHPYSGDIGIELTSPSQTTSLLLHFNNRFKGKYIYYMKLLSNAFYGEESAGDWTLKLIDGRLGNVGTLEEWGINFYGHKEGNDQSDML